MKQQNKKPTIPVKNMTIYYATKDTIQFFSDYKFTLKRLDEIIQNAKKLEKYDTLQGIIIKRPNLKGIGSKKRKSK